jgi:hypothetical protein
VTRDRRQVVTAAEYAMMLPKCYRHNTIEECRSCVYMTEFNDIDVCLLHRFDADGNELSRSELQEDAERARTGNQQG